MPNSETKRLINNGKCLNNFKKVSFPKERKLCNHLKTKRCYCPLLSIKELYQAVTLISVIVLRIDYSLNYTVLRSKNDHINRYLPM